MNPKEQAELRTLYSGWTIDRLRSATTVERADYQPDAVVLMIDELRTRGVNVQELAALATSYSEQATASKRAAYAQWFCEKCMDVTENVSEVSMGTLNGCGFRWIGAGSQCPRCKSVESEVWFCLFFIPVYRVASHRVIFGRGNSFFGSREFISRKIKK